MSKGSTEFNNPLDNSDVPIRDNSKSAVGGMFQSVEQAQEYKLYLENLKLMADLQKSTDKIKVKTGGKDHDITVQALIPKESEFERVRKYTISLLNVMADDELRQWMARFGTDNIFTLSGRIAAYQLDKKKRDEAFKTFDAWK